MYCDLLQDAGAPEEEWQRADRIAASLAADSKLVLINFCEGRSLDNNYLRVGTNWFIGADETRLENYRQAWWRPKWVRSGFRRYPTTSDSRSVRSLMRLNTGTPWTLPHPRFEIVQQRPVYADLIVAFFHAHALEEIPEEYL
jgi:hypothetical protein